MMSNVLSHTLRISVFLSCIRSMRYAGASDKITVKDKTLKEESLYDWTTTSRNCKFYQIKDTSFFYDDISGSLVKDHLVKDVHNLTDKLIIFLLGWGWKKERDDDNFSTSTNMSKETGILKALWWYECFLPFSSSIRAGMMPDLANITAQESSMETVPIMITTSRMRSSSAEPKKPHITWPCN